MKKLKINKMAILIFGSCLVTAFAFLKGSTVSSQINEIKTNPNTEFNITYELDGGKFEDGVTAPTKYKYSQETTIPNPVKEGSEFLGWTINDKQGEPIKDYIIPKGTTGDIKLTANWNIVDTTLVNGVEFNKMLKDMYNNIPVGASFGGIVFKNSDLTNLPNNAVDVSEAQNGSIMMYNASGSNRNNITITISSNKPIKFNKDSSKMFANFDFYSDNTDEDNGYLTFDNIDTSNVTNINSMFEGCTNLNTLDLSSFDTSNVKAMHAVFKDCNELTNLNLSNWNVSNVNTMNNMFYGCISLFALDLSSFNTTSLTNTGLMFTNCSNLTNIKGIENFDTNEITDMYNMFENCTKLSGEITIMNPHMVNYDTMFANCSKDVNSKFYVKYTGDFTKSIAEKMVATKSSNSNVFLYGESTLVSGTVFNNLITTLNNYEKVTTITFLKGIPSNINPEHVDVSESKDNSILAYVAGNVLIVVSDKQIMANPDCSKMFEGCRNIININLSNFDTSNTTDMNHMFNFCNSLTSIDVSSFNTSKVTNMSFMFYNCNKLKNLDVNNFNTSNVTDIRFMFYQCSNLNGEITIMNPYISVYNNMFTLCSSELNTKFIVKYKDNATKEVARKLVETKSENSNVFLYEPPTLVDGQTFNSTIKSMPNFANLTEIRFVKEVPNPNGVDVSEAQDGSIIAYIDGTVLTVACEGEIMANPDCSEMFYQFGDQYGVNKVLNKIILDNFYTSKVINMGSMFDSCFSLKSLDVSNFDTSNVTNMSRMFSFCYNLTSLDLSNWDTSNVTDMSIMFNDCSNLTRLDLSSWNIKNVTDMEMMFYGTEYLSGNITIMNPNIKSYSNMFYDCASYSGKFVVNYTSGCRTIAQNMVNTKSSGNVVLGTQKSLLNEDIPSDEKPSVPDTVVLTIKDGSTTTKKEILAGEIVNLNTPSKEGMIFSGYFYDAEFTKPVSEKDTIDKNTTIYIKWEDDSTNTETPQNEETPQEESKDESIGEVA